MPNSLPPSATNPTFQGYDIEVLKNFFCITFVDLANRSLKYSFKITPWQNDFEELIDHLRTVKGLIGFNSIGYDYPVLHPFISEPERYAHLTGAELVKLIVKRSNKVIDEDFRRDYDKPIIPQRDLFRIWHFNNKARATSLKYLQINLNWPDVREMPIHYHSAVKQGADEDMILSYNLNDVLSTLAFYDKSKSKIKMRKVLGAKYGRDFGNLPDTRIGESIFLITMAKLTGKSEYELSARKTLRKQIILADAIPKGIHFSSDQFNSVLKQFEEKVITNTRKEETISVIFDGMKYDFGFGGLHALRESGVYKNVHTADVGGYYPTLSISKRIYPHHLGEAFCDAHKVIKEERSQYEKGSGESDGLKLAGNGVFGMMGAEWSPFHDNLALMKTTVGGQLLLAQLCEWLTVGGAGRIIMVNTDGFEIEIKDEKKFKRYCELWEKEHNLSLEHGMYKTLAIRDCNNYIGVKTDGKVKEKGDYVCEPEIYKDNSMKIVTRAVKEFFVNGVPVEKTINDCEDIKLFLMGKRAKSGNLEWRAAKNLTELIRERLPKNVRYFVSKSGGSIVKVLKAAAESKGKKKTVFNPNQTQMFTDVAIAQTESKTRIVGIHKGFRVTLFNKWFDVPFKKYNVDKSFYVSEALKLIDPILKTQSKIQ